MTTRIIIISNNKADVSARYCVKIDVWPHIMYDCVYVTVKIQNSSKLVLTS